MSDRPEQKNYDWDRHGDLAGDLANLDDYDLSLSRGILGTDGLMRRLILKGPYGDPPYEDDDLDVRPETLVQYMAVRMRKITAIIYRDVNFSRSRADLVARQMEAAFADYPEEQYRPGLSLMVQSAAGQIACLQERIESLRHIVADDYRESLDMRPYKYAQERLQNLRAAFRDAAGSDDTAPPDPARLENLKSGFAEMAAAALKHTEIQRDLSEQCLALTATDMLLRKIFHLQSSVPVDGYKKVGGHMLVAASLDLDRAAGLRHAVYAMNETGRVSFPR